ncbi:DUF1129 domain-containing protein [Liquorilactobacillus uvarum]|uniref:Integral membrane protein n=1 Tax=Liquorilactobacillus uvarum DSM 19971 TaxID=1423812 RepID=A0A0R1PPW0_9LACO|nr:DUF1129 domain-containing protein [Liquorilactobacillus uvarum]KRL34271.1 hypothetical protein FD20_GL001754 [Liquorilactobacillus uvarum DSM 19971]
MTKENKQNNKQRNQEVAKKQAEKLEAKKSEDIPASSLEGLTKRNEDYMFRLNRMLEEKGVPSEKRKQAVDEMIVELRDKQRQGITAGKLYGTVSERTEAIIAGPKKKAKEPSYWSVALDNGLIMFMMFCIMYAALGAFSKKQAEVNGGILTLIVTSVIAGLGMAYFYKVAGYRRDRRKRIPFWKTLLLSGALVVIWITAYTLVMAVPGALNRTFEPIVYAVLAVIAFGVRYILKKKYGLIGSIF